MKKLFVLYDGRAKTGNTDNASVIVTAGSGREARHEGRTTWKGYDAIWFEYDIRNKKLVNEKSRPDIPPGPTAERR